MILCGLAADLHKEFVSEVLCVEAGAHQVQSHRVEGHAWLRFAVTHVDLNQPEQLTGLVLEGFVQRGQHGLPYQVLGGWEVES